MPAVYDFCEAKDLNYVIGYATNAVLERATAQALADVELYYRCYGYRDPHRAAFRGDPRLPGRQLAAATAGGGQDGDQRRKAASGVTW